MNVLTELTQFKLSHVLFDCDEVDVETLAEIVDGEYGSGVLVADGIVLFSSEDYNKSEVEADIQLIISKWMMDDDDE
jgi:hypothetical protein